MSSNPTHRKMCCARPLVWRIQPECDTSWSKHRPCQAPRREFRRGVGRNPSSRTSRIRRLSSGMWRSRRHIGNAKSITFVKDRMVTTSKIHATESGIPAVGNRSTCSLHTTRCDVAIRVIGRARRLAISRRWWTSSYRAVDIQPRTKIRKGKKIAGPGARAVATLCQGCVRMVHLVSRAHRAPEGARRVHRERQRAMCACIVDGAVSCTAAETFSEHVVGTETRI